MTTLCCPSSSPRQRQQCSGSGHSRPQRELTVSATFRSSRRQRDRDADDRSQGSADVARRMCVARWFPERQLNRCRGHWASKTNRMSAAHGAGLTHPTLRRQWRVAPKLPFKHAPTRFATAGQSPASQSFPPYFSRSRNNSDSGYCSGPNTRHQQKPRRSGVCVFTTQLHMWRNIRLLRQPH